MLRVLSIIIGLVLIGIMIVIIRFTSAQTLLNRLQGKGVRAIVVMGMLGCMLLAVGACGIIFNTFFPNVEDRFEALITTGVMILLIYFLYKLSLSIKSDEYKEFVELERIRLLEEQEEEEAAEQEEDDEEEEEDDEDRPALPVDFSGDDDDFSEFEEYERRVEELNARKAKNTLLEEDEEWDTDEDEDLDLEDDEWVSGEVAPDEFEREPEKMREDTTAGEAFADAEDLADPDRD